MALSQHDSIVYKLKVNNTFGIYHWEEGLKITYENWGGIYLTKICPLNTDCILRCPVSDVSEKDKATHCNVRIRRMLLTSGGRAT